MDASRRRTLTLVATIVGSGIALLDTAIAACAARGFAGIFGAMILLAHR